MSGMPLLLLLAWGLVFVAEARSPHPAKEFDEYLDFIGSSDPPKKRPNDYSESREHLGSGTTTTLVGATDAAGRGVTVQTDGSIIASGRATFTGKDHFAVVRYHPDGDLDTSFATTGKLTFSIQAGSDNVAHGLALQTDGKILLAGKSDLGTTGFYRFAAARVTSNGFVDTSFSTDGVVTVSFGTSVDFARGLVIQTDARIVLAGYSKNTTQYDSAFLRLLTDGSLDTSFNTTGRLRYATEPSDNGGLTVTLTSNGEILAAGNAFNTKWGFLGTRVLSNGTLDTSFNTVGFRRYTIGANDDSAYSIQAAPLGKIVLVGNSNNGSDLDVAAMRLLSDGNFDTSFDTDGKRVYPIGSSDDGAFASRQLASGKLVMAGYSNNGSNNDFAILRVLTDGALDTSFATSGKRSDPISPSDDIAQALYVSDGEGNIILVGRAFVSARWNIAIARYGGSGGLGSSGSGDEDFGN